MPIYPYRCEQCGFTKDVLQKLSDPILTECPSCHAPAYKRQLTAAGFQLKGSGWYATDFKNSQSPKNSVKAEVSPSANKTDSTEAKPQASSNTSEVNPTNTSSNTKTS